MDKNLKTYYRVNFLFNFARVLPHSILTILLMNKGLNLSEISIIQSVFMIVALFSEFPTGIMTEIIGEKRMYQLSLILLACSYTGVYFGKGVIFLSILWGIYGLSAATMSGTLDAYFYKNLKRMNKGIKKFNIQNRYVLLISSLFGAFFGSVLYQKIDVKIYLISAFLLFLSFINCSFGIKITNHSTQQHEEHLGTKMQIKKIINDTIALRTNHNLAILVSLSCIFQLIVQLHFQYWQIIFQDKGINVKYFGLVYVVFQLMGMFSTFIFSKINVRTYGNKIILLLSAIISISFIFSLISSNSVIFILVFMVFLLGFNLYDNTLDYLIVQNVASDFMSSFLSLLGTLSTIFSALVLLLMASFLKFFSLTTIAITMIIVYVLLTFILVVFNRLTGPF